MAYEEKFRKKAVEYKDNGHTFEQLEETFGISSYAYYKWRRNKEISGFYVLPKEGKATRRRKVDPDELLKIVEAKPDLFLKEIAKEFNCSAVAIHKRLKKMKITRKKTFTYSEESEEKRREYLEKLEKIPVHLRVYVDESGVHKHLVREFGRAVRGVKIQDTKRGRKFGKTNVVAARRRDEYGKLHHIAPLCFNHTANSEFFVNWFKTKLLKAIPKGSTIIMDNASHHPPKKLSNLVRRHGMKLLFLPTYSPDFNPIENDWANMKAALVDIMPNFNLLEDGIYWYFESVDN
jgi:transposase